jgi:hypothetical protein
MAGDFSIWTTATAEQLGQLEINYGTTNITALNSSFGPTASLVNRAFTTKWVVTFNSTTKAFGNYLTIGLPNGSTLFNNISSKSPISTTSTTPLGIGIAYKTHGVASGTYTSGISATGAAGTTCLLTAFNGTAGTGATATIYLTGTNTIAASTPLYITNTGTGYTAVSTSATVGNGTATCTGPATIVTVLGGAQGNMMNLNVGTWIQEH